MRSWLRYRERNEKKTAIQHDARAVRGAGKARIGISLIGQVAELSGLADEVAGHAARLLQLHNHGVNRRDEAGYDPPIR